MSKLSYWQSIKEAFNLKIPVPVLGSMPVNKLLLSGFGILGFGHPAFWLLGLAYETAYLMFLPGNPRFQNVIRGQKLQQHKLAWGEKQESLLSMLDRDGKKRYKNLVKDTQSIINTAEKTSSGLGSGGLRSAGLNQLLWMFLKLLVSRQRIDEVLSKKSLRADLEEEIQSITAKIAKEPENSQFRRSLQGTMEIQQRRLDNLLRAAESKRVTEAELDRIEKQITMLAEELAVSTDPSHISLRLDGVMESLQHTSKWMSNNAEFLQSVSEDSLPDELLSSPPFIPGGRIDKGSRKEVYGLT